MDKIIYAIGDVHGRDDLLCELHAHICDHHQLMYPDQDAELIHLGDYIDGGPQSREVIDRLKPIEYTSTLVQIRMGC